MKIFARFMAFCNRAVNQGREPVFTEEVVVDPVDLRLAEFIADFRAVKGSEEFTTEQFVDAAVCLEGSDGPIPASSRHVQTGCPPWTPVSVRADHSENKGRPSVR